MGKFSQYKLPLKTLPQGTQEFEYKLGKQFFEDMENADIHGADLDVHLTATHNGDAYDLVFHITGNIVLLCDRCLDKMDFPVDTVYNITVKYGDRYNDDSDTVLEIPDSENFLNVAYMLHDSVALTIPIKHVHAPGQCNRAMSDLLHKHRVTSKSAETDLEDTLIEEMDSMPDDAVCADDTDNDAPTDPRWDALKGLKDNDDE